MSVGGCPFGTRDSGAGSSVSRHGRPGRWPHSSSQPSRISQGLGLHVGKCYGLLGKGRDQTVPRDPSLELEGGQIAQGRSYPELKVEINAFVTSPSVHAHRSCCGFECKLLGGNGKREMGGVGEGAPLQPTSILAGCVRPDGFLCFAQDLQVWPHPRLAEWQELRQRGRGEAGPRREHSSIPLWAGRDLGGGLSSPTLC